MLDEREKHKELGAEAAARKMKGDVGMHKIERKQMQYWKSTSRSSSTEDAARQVWRRQRQVQAQQGLVSSKW